jgi:hypothetical protein
MIGLTKDNISEGTAKFWILGAVFVASFSGLITAVVAIKRLAGFTPWSLLDAGLCFGLAFGVYRRNLVCAWLLLGYHVVSRVQMFIITGTAPTYRAVTYLLFYSMAIVCIGLYPRTAAMAEQIPSSPGGTGESTQGGRVV